MSTITPSQSQQWTVSQTQFQSISESTFLRQLVLWCWVISLLTPFLFFGWLLYDGYASRSLSGTWVDLFETPKAEPLTQALSGPRLLWVQLITIATGTTGSVILFGFLFGPKQFSGIRCLLGFMLLSGGWLLNLTQWDRIHHVGRTIYVSSEARSVAEFADRVHRNWPALVKNIDNECQFELSSFNAYPIYKPTMLMFLGDQEIPNSPLLFRAIEREDDKAIRFELSGENLGYWIERRYDSQEPSDFIGGLAETYHIGKSRRIADQLYLVDYR